MAALFSSTLNFVPSQSAGGHRSFCEKDLVRQPSLGKSHQARSSTGEAGDECLTLSHERFSGHEHQDAKWHHSTTQSSRHSAKTDTGLGSDEKGSVKTYEGVPLETHKCPEGEVDRCSNINEGFYAENKLKALDQHRSQITKSSKTSSPSSCSLCTSTCMATNPDPKQQNPYLHVDKTEGHERYSECEFLRPLLSGSDCESLIGVSLSSTRFANVNWTSSTPVVIKSTPLAVNTGTPSSPASFNTAENEKPFCRICHEEDQYDNKLISPCYCTGSVNYLHRKCLEYWLQTANKTSCELCGYQFHIVMRTKPFRQWLCHPVGHRDYHNLFADLFIMIIMSAMVTGSSWLCLKGAQHILAKEGGVEEGDGSLSTLEGLGLILLTTVLIGIYLFWLMVTIRYYFIVWQSWSRKNLLLTVLQPSEYQDDCFKPS